MLIVTALSIEAESLIAAISAKEVKRYGGKYPLYHGGAYDILVCGLGKERARQQLSTYLKDRKTQYILNAGGVGILDSTLQKGSLYEVREVCSEDAEEVLQLRPFSDLPALRCVSVEQAVRDAERRERIFHRSGAGIVDMECLFLAEVAAEHALPFSAIKVSCDFADADTEADYRRHIRDGMALLSDYLFGCCGIVNKEKTIKRS